MIKPQTLKGFRDFLPPEAKKRQYVLNKLRNIFEYYDFQPLETPALEYEEVLMGKYGHEGEKLMYKFTDKGGRKVAMRYDQTVPLARVIAQYQNDISTPFMRYQIQNVWRSENTQKGRFREFLQCDVDIVGTNSSTADAQILLVAASGLFELGFKNFKILINDREIFQDTAEILRSKFPNLLEKQLHLFLLIAKSMDKIKKIGKEGVIKELINEGFTKEEATTCIDIVNHQKPTKRINEIMEIINIIRSRLPSDIVFEFSPSLARGLDYYTSTIFEIEIDGYKGGSVAGGGRYDELIGKFFQYGKKIPAVGFAYGVDRIMDAIEELNIKLPIKFAPDILISVQEATKNESLKYANFIRNEGLQAEIFLGDRDTPLDKQLRYADKKNIPYVLIIENENLFIKNMHTGDKELTFKEDVITKLKNSLNEPK